MKVTMKLNWIAAVAFGLLAARVVGFEFPLSHSMGTGGVPILSSVSPSDMIDLPGSFSDRFTLGFESGYLRRYDLGDLDRVYLAAAGRHHRFFGGIGLAQFGKSELYTEKIVKASVAYLLRDFTIGGSASIMQVEFGGNYGQFSLATCGLGAGYTRGQFRALVAADNLTNPTVAPSSEPYRRTAAAIAEWTTRRRLSTVVRATKTENQSVKYGIGQRIPLAHGSGLYWGISTRPIEYGGGIDVATKLFTLTYGARIHPVLGMSHSVSISIIKSRVQNPPAGDSEDRDE